MKLSYILSINQDIVQVHYNKEIKLFSKNIVDVALKTSEYIRKAKKHQLMLEMAISDMKSCLLLVIFSNSHLIIGTSEIQLSKPLDLT